MLRNMKIGIRLAVGFVVIFAVFSAMILFTVSQMKYISEQTALLYRHPFTVTSTLYGIESDMAQIRQICRDIVLMASPEDIAKNKALVDVYEHEIYDGFNVLKERFLGDKEKVVQAETLFRQIRPIRDRIFSLAMEGKTTEAANVLNGEWMRHTAKIIDVMAHIRNFAKNKAAVFYANADNAAQEKLTLVYFLFALALAIGLAFAYLFTRSIVTPVFALMDSAQRIGQGDLAAPIDTSSKDEIGHLALSIERMVASLRTQMQERERQDWLKTGLAELSQKLRGEQSLEELGRRTISYLCTYCGARVGALYLFDPLKERFNLIASYAYTRRKSLSGEFGLGEGLVGQCALEKQPIIVSSLPADYLSISSGLGEALPASVLVAPFLFEGEVRGVIEFGTFGQITDIMVQLVGLVTDNIAVAFNTARNRARTQELLSETQTQAEELQAQQEELRCANEELEDQTKALKESEARLQVQQEELQQSNEELEERALLLEKQKSEINKKNKALEAAQTVIEEKAKAVETASKYKSEFLANMSHELRTPLNSMLLLSQHLAENKDGTLTQKQVEFATTIHSSGKDLLAIINDILDLSKVESGKMEVTIEEISLAECTASMERGFRETAKEKELAFTVTLEEGLPEYIATDRQKLDQILRNLLSNAFKFTEKGSITLSVHRPSSGCAPLASGMPLETAIAFTVADTGIGIPADKRALIFEAFHQVDGTTSRKYGGTGLGLSISRELARLLAGEIGLEAQEGKGASFTLYVPENLRPVQTAPRREAPSAQAKVPTFRELGKEVVPVDRAPGKTVAPEPPALSSSTAITDDRETVQPEDKLLLIIEDDSGFARILLDLAREKGFKGIVAGDGQKGIECAVRYKPQAIILDLGLPVMDGWTVIDRLKNDPATRNIMVHIISGTEKNKDALKMGAAGYLTKPVSMAKLMETFNTIDQTVSREHRKLLCVNLDKDQEQTIRDITAYTTIETTMAQNAEEACRLLETRAYDCIVVNPGPDATSGIDLAERLKKNESLADLPVIVYNTRDLSREDALRLRKITNEIVSREVRSSQRLLDEIVLFLHLVETNLPQEKQRILRMMHDRETIFKDKKILIIDDDVRNVFALSSILEEKGVEVFVGRDGMEGLTCLEKNGSIDLVITDIMMPEMDGYTAIREIRKRDRYRNIPIIALTAKAMMEDRQKCIEAGANDYLAKPVDAQLLLSLLRVWLYR